MRLQKQLSRKVGDKKYAKYVAVIPSKIIEKVGFKEGEELLVAVKNGTVVIGRK